MAREGAIPHVLRDGRRVVFQGNSELYLSYDAPEIPANLPGKCVFTVCVYLVSVSAAALGTQV